jgi:energy-coupling factor transport system substrate-specific component
MKQLELKKVYITLSLAALGLALGSIVSFLKLPIYLDTLGIMLATLLLDWRYGTLCAIITAGAAFFVVSPFIPFYLPAMLVVVFLTEFLARRGMYNSFIKSVWSGTLHGIAGTLISAPITYFVFNGFTSSGNDIIVALFISHGASLFLSIIFSLLIFAVIDRILTCLLCTSITKALPRNFFKKNSLRILKNEEIKS